MYYYLEYFLPGFYYLSVTDRSEKKEQTLELIETLYKDKLAETSNRGKFIQLARSEPDSSNDNLNDRDDNADISDNRIPKEEENDDLYADDNFLQKIRKEHNLQVIENDIAIETIDENVTPTKNDVQADVQAPSVLNEKNEEPERLVRKTMIESNDWDNDENGGVNQVEGNDLLVNILSENDADAQLVTEENLKSADHMSGDNQSNDRSSVENKTAQDMLSENDQASNIEEMTESSQNISVVEVPVKERYPLSELMNETGLGEVELDQTYNLTRVQNVDLHNLSFLDNFYRYNYKVNYSERAITLCNASP